jgi:uncharacterized protein YutE (UPF0331/DUF86 family)
VDGTKRANCRYENVSATNLIDGLSTLSGTAGCGVSVPSPGDGPDSPLEWSIRDVIEAVTHADAPKEQARLCTNAIINARRALGCLVDWYVQRDLANKCKTPPGSSKRKAEFLVQRGIIDGLTSRVLARAINKRNDVEHGYVAPDVGTTEDVVELIRRTMATLREQSDPSYGPWMFGTVNYGDVPPKVGPVL